MSTTTYHHRPPTKIHSPLPTISQKMDHHPAKAKIYSYRHCFNSFFFFLMQYSFPWRRFCGIKFWSVRFSNSKFLLHSVYFTFKISCNFIKKEALAQVFSCEFCEILLRTPFATENLRWLLLNISFSITVWRNCVKVKKTLN